MDRLVDQAVTSRRADESGVSPAHDDAGEDESDSEDIESELFSSTREAGIAAVAYDFPADDGSD
jgi:hypothetical protein